MESLQLQCKFARMRADLTQQDAAAKLGTSIEYLNLVENGKRRLTLDMLGRMAKAYGHTLVVHLAPRVQGSGLAHLDPVTDALCEEG